MRPYMNTEHTIIWLIVFRVRCSDILNSITFESLITAELLKLRRLLSINTKQLNMGTNIYLQRGLSRVLTFILTWIYVSVYLYIGWA